MNGHETADALWEQIGHLPCKNRRENDSLTQHGVQQQQLRASRIQSCNTMKAAGWFLSCQWTRAFSRESREVAWSTPARSKKGGAAWRLEAKTRSLMYVRTVVKMHATQFCKEDFSSLWSSPELNHVTIFQILDSRKGGGNVYGGMPCTRMRRRWKCL